MFVFTVPANEEKQDKKCQKTVSNVPGPYPLPIFGTRWIFSYIGSYKLNKIHDAYRGKEFGPGLHATSALLTSRL